MDDYIENSEKIKINITHSNLDSLLCDLKFKHHYSKSKIAKYNLILNKLDIVSKKVNYCETNNKKI